VAVCIKEKRRKKEEKKMEKFICKFAPADLIAVIVIIGGLILKLNGADGVVGSMLVGVCFYYFGKVGSPFGQTRQNDKI
jgi:hypothetical protein